MRKRIVFCVSVGDMVILTDIQGQLKLSQQLIHKNKVLLVRSSVTSGFVTGLLNTYRLLFPFRVHKLYIDRVRNATI
jgi:hypothetical protein